MQIDWKACSSAGREIAARLDDIVVADGSALGGYAGSDVRDHLVLRRPGRAMRLFSIMSGLDGDGHATGVNA